jgi:hypothetical protein
MAILLDDKTKRRPLRRQEMKVSGVFMLFAGAGASSDVGNLRGAPKDTKEFVDEVMSKDDESIERDLLLEVPQTVEAQIVGGSLVSNVSRL